MTKTKTHTKMSALTSSVFQTELGWMALETHGNTICKLAFGHKNATATPLNDPWIEKLVQRLREYAYGRPVDFDDFEIDTRAMTDFGRRVIRACRKIPYGKTLTYGELAARSGNSAAARAVGNHMARNPIPLIVPCHRVLPAGKGLGGYSAVGGVEMKRLLLKMEASCEKCSRVPKNVF